MNNFQTKQVNTNFFIYLVINFQHLSHLIKSQIHMKNTFWKMAEINNSRVAYRVTGFNLLAPYLQISHKFVIYKFSVI
jgi:hypothetical protein